MQVGLYVQFNNNKNSFILPVKCYVLFASFVWCEPVIDEDDVNVVCVIKFELLLLQRIEYTLSTLLSFSKRGIKSSSSLSDVSSNQDLTGT